LRECRGVKEKEKLGGEEEKKTTKPEKKETKEKLVKRS